MRISRIYDLQKNHVLAIDLRHVLRALGHRARTSVWEVGEETSFNEPVAVTGDAADNLERLSRQSARVAGSELMRLAENVDQVIWGEFRAFEDPASDKPWLIVRAIDSHFYEVESDETAIHDAVDSAFRDVRNV